MSAFLLKPCKGSNGFQGLPDKNLKLELVKLAEILADEGFQEKVCVDIVMVMEKEKLEYTIYPSGKFLIKPAITSKEISQSLAESKANELLVLFERHRKGYSL